jgi:hypothetical protein
VIKTIVKIFIEENIVIVMTVYSHKSITSGSGRDHIDKNTDNVCKKKVWMFKVVSLLSIWIGWLVDFMVLNATFNNISVTSWQPVFLVEETKKIYIYKYFCLFQQIDGEAFLLMDQTDLMKILNLKLGPALKIYNSLLVFKNSIEV